MGEHSYRNVISAFMGKPWAILPEKLAQLSELIAMRVDGHSFSEEEIAERIAAETYAARSKRKMQGGAGVAVIPVYGVITPRADVFTEISGGTSMQSFISAINQAASDSNVASILMEVDSPGGQVDLVPEAAAAIRAARAKKPVVAVSNTMAASAAYWLASQASELIVSPSAEVGSIGVFAAHNDLSEAMAAQGVKTTLVSAGKYKTELSPYQPLSEEAKAGVQATVDEYYSMFIKDVAAGRRVQVSAVRNGMGEGRMLTASNAVQAGMADKVDTFEATLYRMVSQASKSGVTGHTTQRISSQTQDGLLSIEEARNTVLSLPTVETSITFTGNSGNLWPQEMTTSSASDVTVEIGAESDRSDAEPQEQLADLRRQSRKAAISERENYLSLLRRITK